MDSPGRLALAVAARRKMLLLSQEELAAQAGVSLTTVRDVENGRRTSMRASNRRGLATALGWTADSIDRVLRGEDPEVSGTEPGPSPTLRPIGDPVVQAKLDDLERRVAELEEIVRAQGRWSTADERDELERDAERRRVKRGS